MTGQTAASFRSVSNRLRRLIFVLAVAILSCAIGPSNAETIQLERHGGTFTISARINDAMTVPFVLDTGASTVALPRDVFLALVRTGTLKQSDFIGTGTYVLADGATEQRPKFLLRKMTVGHRTVRNVVAIVISLEGEPLLGQTFLSKLPAWAIDNRRQALVIGNGTEAIAPGQGTAAISPPRLSQPDRCRALVACMEAFIRGQTGYDKGDYRDAMRWYRKAAAQGSSLAAFMVGMLYEKGLGVPPDWAQAMRWFQKVAAMGDAKSKALIGVLYAKGLGVPQDCEIAKQWFASAVLAGDEDARGALRDGAGGGCQW